MWQEGKHRAETSKPDNATTDNLLFANPYLASVVGYGQALVRGDS